MDHALFRADDGPAPFRLDLTHLGVRLRPVETHTVAMGHLVKAVFCRHRADLYGFEENVVAGIASHFDFVSLSDFVSLPLGRVLLQGSGVELFPESGK